MDPYAKASEIVEYNEKQIKNNTLFKLWKESSKSNNSDIGLQILKENEKDFPSFALFLVNNNVHHTYDIKHNVLILPNYYRLAKTDYTDYWS